MKWIECPDYHKNLGNRIVRLDLSKLYAQYRTTRNSSIYSSEFYDHVQDYKKSLIKDGWIIEKVEEVFIGGMAFADIYLVRNKEWAEKIGWLYKL